MSYKYRKNLDAYKESERVRQKNGRAKLREYIMDVKKSGCMKCGETHPSCLQFHHRVPSEKIDGVNRILAQSKSLGKLKDEIEKCDLLCANCHAKLHWDEIH